MNTFEFKVSKYNGRETLLRAADIAVEWNETGIIK